MGYRKIEGIGDYPFFVSIFINKTYVMNSTEIKKELHEAIEEADDRLLKLIYGMILADKQPSKIPDWHENIVSERLEEYDRNPEGVISWEELKSTIESNRP